MRSQRVQKGSRFDSSCHSPGPVSLLLPTGPLHLPRSSQRPQDAPTGAPIETCSEVRLIPEHCSQLPCEFLLIPGTVGNGPSAPHIGNLPCVGCLMIIGGMGKGDQNGWNSNRSHFRKGRCPPARQIARSAAAIVQPCCGYGRTSASTPSSR